MNLTRNPISFLDLTRQYALLKHEIDEAIQRVVDRGFFASNQTVAAFEEDFARYCRVRYCVGVNSGTSALHLAMIACGIGPGDEVITVPFSFISTAWAISYVGARPVFVDIDPDTYTMDATQVEGAITSKTRALLPVHLYGQMANLEPLAKICRQYRLTLVEDAAQAHGAEYMGRRAGSYGNIGCFSFYPTKNLGAFGEAGAITTNDAAIAERVRSLRDHAQDTRYRHKELGFNYRMDEIQAAVLRIKLGHLEKWIAARRKLAKRYQNSLRETAITFPREAEKRRHVWHLFVVRYPNRDQLQQALSEGSIGTGIHYPRPIHLQPAYAHLGYQRGDFPVAEKISSECLSLPIFPELQEEEQDYICQVLAIAIAET